MLYSIGNNDFKEIKSLLGLPQNKPLNYVLDVGCSQGAGPIFSVIQLNVRHVLGIDSDSSAIRIAKTNVHKIGLKNCIHFKDQDLFDFFNQKVDNKYDLIVANGVLPYILEKDRLLWCFKKIEDYLSDTGVFCFTMFADENPFAKEGYIKDITSFSPNKKHKQFARITSIYELLDMLKRAKMKIFRNGIMYT